MIRGDTKLYSLYGSPVSHSLSPIIFNATFEKLSLNRTYLPFEVNKDQAKQAVEAARTLGFEGFNVTMPLKTIIRETLDRLDESAEDCGSVNTVANCQGRLIGYNTDGEGAVRALRAYGFEPRGKRIAVLGAGGAAQALVHRFSREKNTITILNRTVNWARELANSIAGDVGVSYEKLDRDNLENCFHNTDVVVNATPIQTPALLSQLRIPIHGVKYGGMIFDLAYDTPSEPIPGGIGSVSPLEMLVQQAALSYEIWLNQAAPLALMRSSLVDYLGKDWK